MVVSFCGHAQFYKNEEFEKKILTFLEEKVGNQAADMYLGGYGDFDDFAFCCCKKYKMTHPNISLVFVTPYLDIEYQRKHLNFQKGKYDLIIYPEIENKPKKFAISYRNKYMMEKADYVIAYVSHSWGGAYASYKYARKKRKEIFNLAQFQDLNE